MAVLLKPAWRAMKTFAAMLRQARGSVVPTSSVHAVIGLPGHAAYAAAKGALCSLGRQLAVEYGPDIRVNTVLPGPHTAAGTILRCRIDPLTGDLLGSPETFAQLRDDEGSPDGMTVDAEGRLWVALWGAGAVRRYHPDGHLLHTLTVPAPHPTSVCLPPGGNRLYVTTARYGVTNPTAASGAVLSIAVPVAGTPACSWGVGR